MSGQRPKRETMCIEEAPVSKRWGVAARKVTVAELVE
jgi:hypothetical protein